MKPGTAPAPDVGRRLVDQARTAALVEQGHLDPLALARAVAMVQGGEDRHRGVQAGEHVDDRDAGLGRLVRAGDAHQPAHRLHEQVVAGQVARRHRSRSR